MNTEILKCKNCENKNIKHEFQDQRYGKYFRLFNTGPSVEGGTGKIKCTVCGLK